jgi:alkylation response protein AidB-like acyl-CoA dehydrogenase
MRLVPSQEERDLEQLARDVLAAEWPTSEVRRLREPGGDRFPASLWKALATAGLLGLATPEDRGGSGGAITDLGVLAVELGRGLGPTLVHGTTMLGLAIDALGDDRHRGAVLPRLAAGDLRGTTALASPYDAADLAARVGLDGDRASGVLPFVPDADLADLLLVTARADQQTVGLLIPTDARGVRIETRPVMGGDRYARVSLDGVAVPADQVLAGPDGAGLPDAELRRISHIGVTLLGLDLVGVGLAALDRTVAHTRSREQFGRPIASFQAAQHLVANMHIAVHGAWLAGHAALARLADGEQATRETAVARMHASHAAKLATLDAHQLHGGMGYVLETDLHLWSERARILSTFGGGADVAAEWLADEVAAR